MNAQEAVDAGRIHHQWLPDRISYEEIGFSPDTIALLKKMGHTRAAGRQPGRRAGDRLQPEGRHARRRPRSPGGGRRRGGEIAMRSGSGVRSQVLRHEDTGSATEYQVREVHEALVQFGSGGSS